MKESQQRNEVRDRAHEALVMQVHQLAEEFAQLKRERDELATGVVVYADIDEDTASLSEWLTPTEDLVSHEDLVAEVKVPHESHPVLIIAPNKVEDEGSKMKKRKVSWEDIGQFIVNRPRNKNNSILMPITWKQLWI